MRKVLLILLIYLPVLAQGQTSKYHPFPDSNAVWNISNDLGCLNGYASQSYSIVMSSDTVINKQNYKKLVVPGVKFYSSGCGNPMPLGYKGAIRQDTAARKVYFYPAYENKEFLLYDFNMKVGDTVKGYITYHFPPDTVYAIDSVLVGSSYRKRWLISPCYSVYFIEGIGSTWGLYHFSPGCGSDMGMMDIACFKQNGVTLYHPNTNSECKTISSVLSPSSSRKVQVYPNPSATGTFTINWNNNPHIKELRVVDLLGKTVLLNQSPENNQLQILLKRGTYILQVIGEGNEVNREVLVAL